MNQQFERFALIEKARLQIGVPTRFLITKTEGNVWALDSDLSSLQYLETKIKQLSINAKWKLIHGYFPEKFIDEPPNFKFDIIWAEGLLNVIGFEKGISHILDYLKPKGFIIIHDEFARKTEKLQFLKSLNLQLFASFELGTEIWLQQYYHELETVLEDNAVITKQWKEFQIDWNEILQIKANPEMAHSIFYLIQNN